MRREIVRQELDEYDDEIEQTVLPPSQKVVKIKGIPIPVNPKAFGRISKRTWITLGCTGTAMFLYFTQVVKPNNQTVTSLNNPTDVRNIPSYNQEGLESSRGAALGEMDRNFSALIAEERQRTILTMSQQYIAASNKYSSAKGHKCFGKEVSWCLNTFTKNRIAEVEAAALGTTGAPVVVNQGFLSDTLSKLVAVQKAEALRIAKILVLPRDQRTSAQQQVLDLHYPIININAGANLSPRTATVVAEYKAMTRSQAENVTIEDRQIEQLCGSLEEEQRSQTAVCN